MIHRISISHYFRGSPALQWPGTPPEVLLDIIPKQLLGAEGHVSRREEWRVGPVSPNKSTDTFATRYSNQPSNPEASCVDPNHTQYLRVLSTLCCCLSTLLVGGACLFERKSGRIELTTLRRSLLMVVLMMAGFSLSGYPEEIPFVIPPQDTDHN